MRVEWDMSKATVTLTVEEAKARQKAMQGLAEALRDCCDAYELNHPPGSETIARARKALDAARPFLERK